MNLQYIISKINFDKKGFTLIEALVAISILLVVATYPLAQLSQSIQQSRYSEENFVGTMLAQEGIEIARSVRDAERLSMIDAISSNDIVELSTLSGCITSFPCVALVNAAGTSAISNMGGDYRMYQDPSSKQFMQGNNLPSSYKILPYQRTIVFEFIESTRDPVTSELKGGIVTSKVTWQQQNGQIRTVTAKEVLYRFQ